MRPRWAAPWRWRGSARTASRCSPSRCAAGPTRRQRDSGSGRWSRCCATSAPMWCRSSKSPPPAPASKSSPSRGSSSSQWCCSPCRTWRSRWGGSRGRGGGARCGGSRGRSRGARGRRPCCAPRCRISPSRCCPSSACTCPPRWSMRCMRGSQSGTWDAWFRKRDSILCCGRSRRTAARAGTSGWWATGPIASGWSGSRASCGSRRGSAGPAHCRPRSCPRCGPSWTCWCSRRARSRTGSSSPPTWSPRRWRTRWRWWEPAPGPRPKRSATPARSFPPTIPPRWPVRCAASPTPRCAGRWPRRGGRE